MEKELKRFAITAVVSQGFIKQTLILQLVDKISEEEALGYIFKYVTDNFVGGTISNHLILEVE